MPSGLSPSSQVAKFFSHQSNIACHLEHRILITVPYLLCCFLKPLSVSISRLNGKSQVLKKRSQSRSVQSLENIPKLYRFEPEFDLHRRAAYISIRRRYSARKSVSKLFSRYIALKRSGLTQLSQAMARCSRAACQTTRR